MEKWCEIRQRVLRDGVSIRQIQRETGLHFETIKKVLAHSIPPQFQTPIRDKPKIGPYLERIAGIMQADRERPRKQRHTAKRIFQRLQQEGYSGGYSSGLNMRIGVGLTLMNLLPRMNVVSNHTYDTLNRTDITGKSSGLALRLLLMLE